MKRKIVSTTVFLTCLVGTLITCHHINPMLSGFLFGIIFFPLNKVFGGLYL